MEIFFQFTRNNKGIKEKVNKFRDILKNFQKDIEFRKEGRIDKTRRIKSMPTEELKKHYFKKETKNIVKEILLEIDKK